MQNLVKSSLLVLALSMSSAAITYAQVPLVPPAPPATAPHQPNPEHEAKVLSKKLGLTPDQTAQIEPILADREQAIHTLTSTPVLAPTTVRKERREILAATDAKLNAVLSPAQQQEYAALKAERHHSQPAGKAASASSASL
jgi:Spy/CpxP family protein refolding chaperone